MAYYHDIKEHLSPSALSQWLNGRGQFVRSYFAGEKGPETKAMTAGTEIHALIEAGIIKAKHGYAHNEEEVRVQVPGTDLFFMGKPDSYGPFLGYANFVDYKSGKANNWQDKLPTDIKMRATAWLVWIKCEQPDYVRGYIEFFQTTWDPDQKKVVPVDDKETEVVSIIYTAKEMELMTKVIRNEMQNVNEFYEKWLKSSGEFVNNIDVEEAVELRNAIKEAEETLAEVEERILAQMDFGGVLNHKTDAGTFFVKETVKYEYPPELEFLHNGKYDCTLAEAEQMASEVKAAKKNYELINEPVGEPIYSLTFRAAKEK